jgi:hypothetical protein
MENGSYKDIAAPSNLHFKAQLCMPASLYSIVAMMGTVLAN